MTPVAAVDPSQARARARAILSQRRFRRFEQRGAGSRRTGQRRSSGLSRWLGNHVGDPLVRLLRPVGRLLAAFGTPLGVAVLIVAAVLVAVVVARRRIGSATATPRPEGQPEESADPEQLERAADDAERGGELGRAIRLRFRAGLLRLDRAGRIRLRPSLTTANVSRSLASPTFDQVAGSFDAVTYGEQPATPADADLARTAWPRILEERPAAQVSA